MVFRRYILAVVLVALINLTILTFPFGLEDMYSEVHGRDWHHKARVLYIMKYKGNEVSHCFITEKRRNLSFVIGILQGTWVFFLNKH